MHCCRKLMHQNQPNLGLHPCVNSFLLTLIMKRDSAVIYLKQHLAHSRHSKNINSIHFLSSLQSQFRVISGMFYEAFLSIVGNAEQLSESQYIKTLRNNVWRCFFAVNPTC